MCIFRPFGVSEESSTTFRSLTAIPNQFIVRRSTRVKRAVIASSFVGLATLAGDLIKAALF
jgi:hypothetical protein